MRGLANACPGQWRQHAITGENLGRSVEEDRLARLRPREREVLRLAALPKSSKEIAIELGLSPRTVDNYITSAVATLEARDRRHAARIVVQADQLGIEQKLPGQLSPVASMDGVAAGSVQQPIRAAAPKHAGFENLGAEFNRPDFTSPGNTMFGAFAKGIRPDDVKPPVRLMAILLASIGLALCLAAAVILVDAFTRFAHTIGT
jgi:DNA-binding CsgD family transcriptional regulator